MTLPPDETPVEHIRNAIAILETSAGLGIQAAWSYDPATIERVLLRLRTAVAQLEGGR